MRRIGQAALIALLAAVAAAVPAVAEGGEVSLLLGRKSLSDDALDDAGADGQSEIGVLVTLDFDWPVALAIDLLRSSDDARRTFNTPNPLRLDTDVSTLELDVGVRKSWEKSKLRPYVGGGLAFVRLDAEQIESGTLGGGAPFSTLLVDDSDNGFGFWLGGGVVYLAGERFSVGVDLRYSDAGADLSPPAGGSTVDVDSGGTHLGLIAGYRW